MKTYFLGSLSAGAIVLLTSWLLAGEVGAEGEDVQDFVFLAEARPVLVRWHVRVDGKPLASAWDDFMKHLFAYLDVNGDGVLNKQEAERAPAVNQLVNFYGAFNQSAGSEPKMEALDSDKDGKVSRSELSTYYRKNGFRPFQFQLDMTPPPASAAMALYMGGARPDPEVTALSTAIFALLDRDKDGKLTQKELDAAPMVLLARDENEDEIITGQELVPHEKPKSDFLSLAMMSIPKKASAAGNPFLVPIATPGDAPAELARRMQERYDPKTKPLDKLNSPSDPPKPAERTAEAPTNPLSPSKRESVKDAKSAKENDKDKEKKQELPCRLPRNQLGLNEATFAQLDTDKNGVLDAKEIAGFVQRPPDLCMIFAFGDKAGKPVGLATVAGRPAALTDKIHIQDAVGLLDLGATRMELRRGEEKNGYNRLLDIVKQQFTALFKAADKDNNGYLDEKEAQGRPEFKRIFKQIDRDGDGRITEKDLLAYFDAMTELRQRATKACVTLVLRDQSRGLFDLLDSDRDGRLSVREMKQAPKLLAKLDRQGKGYLEVKDIPPCYQLTLRRGAAESGFNQEEFFIERYFGGSSEETPAGRGPAWFRKMDRNRDGDVSRKEFLFSEELFRKLDTDGDGLINLEEAEKAGK
jgi:Ca2+-binding EF-hand superfamily protein